ncbi:hypothetical protein HPB52_014499 [Rhipicephalus sanguineus]|uniref:Uncharacterized protein n=1 Tax=Rhipicephalus sanguineus TaxID=34632 RepID=A0A9D4PWJ2_RHISA|nr:hypothetical protein HPB52_014499 [Rhipicephalus sanguineus]
MADTGRGHTAALLQAVRCSLRSAHVLSFVLCRVPSCVLRSFSSAPFYKTRRALFVQVIVRYRQHYGLRRQEEENDADTLLRTRLFVRVRLVEEIWSTLNAKKHGSVPCHVQIKSSTQAQESASFILMSSILCDRFEYLDEWEEAATPKAF